MIARFLRESVFVGALSLAACGASEDGRSTLTPAAATETKPPASGAFSLRPSDRANAIHLECSDADRCNALDDDCDGRIDEGCSDASLPIHAAWNSAVAIELGVGRLAGDAAGGTAQSTCEGARRISLRPSAVDAENLLWARIVNDCGEEQPTTLSVAVTGAPSAGALTISLPSSGEPVAIGRVERVSVP